MADDIRDVVRQLRSSEVETSDKVELLHLLSETLPRHNGGRELIAAQVVVTLVQLSTNEWPEDDGDLSKSQSRHDVSVQLKPDRRFQQLWLDSENPLPRNAPCMYHSVRRVAIGCLVEICTYKECVEVMNSSTNFFSQLPRMLHHTCKVYKYSQSYADMYGVRKGRYPDHAQYIMERLVCIVAWALKHLSSRRMFDFLTEQCVPVIVQHIDMFMYEGTQPGPHNVSADPFPLTFSMLISNMLAAKRPLSRKAQIDLVKHGILAKITNIPPDFVLSNVAFFFFKDIHESIVEEVYLPRVHQHLAIISLASDVLKDKGNQLFAAGAHKAATAQYRAALRVNHWNQPAAANYALCLLRMGKAGKALHVAVVVVQLDPSWAKGWARLGAAFQGLGDRGKAAKCISIACRLQPQMQEEYKQVLDSEAGDQASYCTMFEDMLEKLVGLADAAPKVALGLRQEYCSWTVSAATFGPPEGALGEPIYFLQVSSAGAGGGPTDYEQVEGLPAPATICSMLKRAMVTCGYRPMYLLVAFRLAYAWPYVRRVIGQDLQVEVRLESKQDSMLSATRHGNDYLGFNGQNGWAQEKYTPYMVDL